MKPGIKVIRIDSHGNESGLNQLITVKETATLLDCTEQTVRAMVRRKELPAVKIGTVSTFSGTSSSRSFASRWTAWETLSMLRSLLRATGKRTG